MKRLLIAACAFSIFATGCDTYSYPTPELTKAEMKKNDRVYGDVGGEPHQHKNPNTPDPDQIAKAAEMKSKLFAEEYPATATKGSAMKMDMPAGSASASGAAAPASDSGAKGSEPMAPAAQKPAQK